MPMGMAEDLIRAPGRSLRRTTRSSLGRLSEIKGHQCLSDSKSRGCIAKDEALLVKGHLDGPAQGLGEFDVLQQSRT